MSNNAIKTLVPEVLAALQTPNGKTQTWEKKAPLALKGPTATTSAPTVAGEAADLTEENLADMLAALDEDNAPGDVSPNPSRPPSAAPSAKSTPTKEQPPKRARAVRVRAY